jgi:hypothetical protein
MEQVAYTKMDMPCADGEQGDQIRVFKDLKNLTCFCLFAFVNLCLNLSERLLDVTEGVYFIRGWCEGGGGNGWREG